MRFEFATTGRIVFGVGAIQQVTALVRPLGRRVFLVTGRSIERAEPIRTALESSGLPTAVWSLEHEPTIGDVARASAAARAANSDVVIGFGGGSALDGAKAVSALMTNSDPVIEYLEVIGRARPLPTPAAPCICIPTTAGTGSEVTRNAVLASPEHRVKVSLRSPSMLPRVALIDPELTRELPPALTATTGLDALTQLIEPFLCTRANPLTDGFCREGLVRAARSLRVAVNHGRDLEARTDMCAASLCGGLALANAGLGAVHGLAGPIGGRFPAPHGAVCAALLPHVLAKNLEVLRERSPDSAALPRFNELARILTGYPLAEADDAVRWTHALVRELKIAGISSYGITAADHEPLVNAAAQSSSMQANPIALTPAELRAILEAAA